ncbi:MAG: hypothetical protein HLX50_08975 [Alteromonadaceae bacterium]|nr:hypothetical protein [Alteromonadaceae bacterium]
MKETRRAQHLRILQHGHRDTSEDYREVQYLKDKGLLSAEIQISYRKEDYAQPIDALWIGPTAEGRDYLDQLLEENASHEHVDKLANGDTQQHLPGGDLNSGNQQAPETTNKLRRAFNQTSTAGRFLWITAIGAVVGGLSFDIVSRLLALHFEFFQ